MRGSELKQEIRESGCLFYREGRRHEIWLNPKTGKKFQIPRHDNQEIPQGTLKSIKKSAGIE